MTQLTPISMPRGKFVEAEQLCGARRHHQVREPVHQHAEKGRRAVAPLLAQGLTTGAADVDAVEGAGDGVEAGGVDDDVEVMVARAGPDAGPGDALDSVFR